MEVLVFVVIAACGSLVLGDYRKMLAARARRQPTPKEYKRQGCEMFGYEFSAKSCDVKGA